MTIIACFGLRSSPPLDSEPWALDPELEALGPASYHLAFTVSFSGYPVPTGDVNLKNGSFLSSPTSALRYHSRSCSSVSGRTFVGYNSGKCISTRKSVGVW